MIDKEFKEYIITILIDEGFTIRQMDVALMMLEGHPSKIIADHLKITDATVKDHLTKIFQKSKCDSKYKFIIKFYESYINKKLKPNMYLSNILTR